MVSEFSGLFFKIKHGIELSPSNIFKIKVKGEIYALKIGIVDECLTLKINNLKMEIELLSSSLKQLLNKFPTFNF